MEKNNSPESLFVVHVFINVLNIFLSLEQIYGFSFYFFCIVVPLNLDSLNIAGLQCDI